LSRRDKCAATAENKEEEEEKSGMREGRRNKKSCELKPEP